MIQIGFHPVTCMLCLPRLKYGLIVYFKQTRQKIQVTGHGPIRTTAPQMFVEQETSWQGDSCELIVMKDYFPQY